MHACHYTHHVVSLETGSENVRGIEQLVRSDVDVGASLTHDIGTVTKIVVRASTFNLYCGINVN
jgi:hypothetical protein